MPGTSGLYNGPPSQMRTPRRQLPLLAAFGILLAGLTACGGSGGGGSTSSTGAEPQAATPTTQANGSRKAPGGKRSGERRATESSPGPPASAFHPKPHHDSGGGSKQFVVKGGDNSIQEFGSEARESEFHEAAAALHDFLDARAERNWAAACAHLARSIKQSLWQLGARGGSSGGRSCASTLAALTGNLPAKSLREAAIANVGSLRAKGDRGFLIYRGAGGTVYAISTSREGGRWKLASLAGVPLS